MKEVLVGGGTKKLPIGHKVGTVGWLEMTRTAFSPLFLVFLALFVTQSAVEAHLEVRGWFLNLSPAERQNQRPMRVLGQRAIIFAVILPLTRLV